MQVTDVEPLAGRRLRLTFDDGSRREVDLRPHLRGPVFERIAAERDFFLKVRVDPEIGTIVWPNGADFCPDVLHSGRFPAGGADRSRPDQSTAGGS